jgi:hypothetical protein
VAYGVPIEATEAEKAKEEKLKFGFAFDVRYEVDDNPTQDLSLPISVSDIGELEGVVDDSEQEDNRTVVKGLVTANRGKLSGYAGFVDTSYDKAINKLLNSQVIFLGGNLKFGGSSQYLLGASWSDVNLGGADYATQLTVSPAYESRGSDEDGTNRKLYGLDVTSKSFADSARENGTELGLKRAYSSLDKAKQDSYKSLFAIGTRTEGTLESEFNYFRSDFDWVNKWDSGVKWDIGFGYQYRDYSNDKDILTDELFGSTRVDNVFHFTTGVGLEFWKMTAMFNYRYVFDLSNDSPYVRQIYGLSLQGAF